ncbi:MAG: alpha/beta-type small acid-soluble spore protein [Clostridiales bacterium]|nr:alpha/beta-type small acid-soluble spore protein [Clostridiales bacterium]
MPEKKKKNKQVLKEKVLTENDLMKYEIAEELGLMDKVRETGWKSLTAKESGRIGGLMNKRNREKRSGEEIR